MTILAFICGALALLPLIAVLFYVIIQGLGSFRLSLFTELPPPPLVKGGGFGNAIVGTLIMVGIGALISIPFGVLAAIYLTEFSSGKFLVGCALLLTFSVGYPQLLPEYLPTQ
jgi:phosphate ABC transporter membrane protein